MHPLLRPSIPLLLLFLLLSGSAPPIYAFNITRILAQHPEFSTFNHYLSASHLAGEINRRKTVTILAVSNSAMADLLAKNLTLYTLKNVLALHVLVDYFGAKQLHQLTGGTTLTSTLFQATGSAPGTTGFVNITLHRAGRVSFSAADTSGHPPVSFVKSVKEIPYDLAVIQISAPLFSPEAEAPTAAPTDVNITSLMAKKGCKTFADLLDSTGDAAAAFAANVGSGLTAFCPIDQAMEAFLPRFKNLTADEKLSMLLYHAVPIYYSIQLLKSNNGVISTLATDGRSKNYNFTVQNDGEVVTLRTKVTTAKITGTLIDEDPLAVYTIDAVLEPRELFKPVKAPAPAPETVADSPKAGNNKKHKHAPAPVAPAADEPAASPNDNPADQKVADDDSSAAGGRDYAGAGKWITWPAAAAAAAMVAALVLAY
ncbi:Fasciclin-like arabinogalactan protein 2 [Apostasia shenzhenica]|uniref:Fasciclin-like arabinogalactan protein 2 n=1 Tax=Apostasia shenzhenica TaxID=1088818 RepID=A0A2I0AWC4_9ASPA|nr:Fasciclin-like arabinogalactan protein 2 [Apostasia shenzhenica]